MSSDATSSQRPDLHPDAPSTRLTTDSAILGQDEAQRTTWSALARLQSGAMVYTSDGAQVAVVDIVAPERITVRAGFPGRPLDLPTDVVASVSSDGQRLDIHMSEREVERLVGQDQPGYAHLKAQQAFTLHDSSEEQTQPAPNTPDAQ